MKPVRIFIADDHQLMLEGLAKLIESIEGFVLAGKVNSGKALIEDLMSSKILPDLCIVDIEMHEFDGIETVKKIRERFPVLKIIALTMHTESHFVSRMIAAGANGYLIKNVDRDVFIKSIYSVLQGGSFVTAGISYAKNNNTQLNELSQRERQILKLIIQGKNNKEIGEELFISDRTADTHRTNIKRKLRLSTLAQLIQFARENGLD